ncbi:MAG: hypothetical protein ACJATK_002308 [Paracoccaceae bacterium]|jgi:hypothetical protein
MDIHLYDFSQKFHMRIVTLKELNLENTDDAPPKNVSVVG